MRQYKIAITMSLVTFVGAIALIVAILWHDILALILSFAAVIALLAIGAAALKMIGRIVPRRARSSRRPRGPFVSY